MRQRSTYSGLLLPVVMLGGGGGLLPVLGYGALVLYIAIALSEESRARWLSSTRLAETAPFVTLILISVLSTTWNFGDVSKLGFSCGQLALAATLYFHARGSYAAERLLGMNTMFLITAAYLFINWQLGSMDWTYANSNALASYIAIALSFLIISAVSRREWVAHGAVGLVYCGMLAIAGARGVFVLLLAASVVWVALPRLGKHGQWWCFGGVVLACWAIILLFVNMNDVLGAYLDVFAHASEDWTGKNLQSGRNRMWPELIDAIQLRPWLGYGAGAAPGVTYSEAATHLSAHNLYLQTAFQVGMIGLAALTAVLASVFLKVSAQSKHDPAARACSALMAGLLVEQSFEVVLTQNNFFLGLGCWVFFGLGSGRSRSWGRGSAWHRRPRLVGGFGPRALPVVKREIVKAS